MPKGKIPAESVAGIDWSVVGQFRTAGGLVLPSGRKLGPQMFLPLTAY